MEKLSNIWKWMRIQDWEIKKIMKKKIIEIFSIITIVSMTIIAGCYSEQPSEPNKSIENPLNKTYLDTTVINSHYSEKQLRYNEYMDMQKVLNLEIEKIQKQNNTIDSLLFKKKNKKK